MLLQMEIAGLTLDPNTQGPVVLLREVGGQRYLPIWIGMMEASAIAMALDGLDFDRPLTHDLLTNTLTALGCELSRVVISRIENNTFYAMLAIRFGAEVHEIDCRPSDAIALAQRAKAIILCDEQVLAEAHVTEAQLERLEPPAEPPPPEDGAGNEAPAGPRAVVTSSTDDPQQYEELLRSLDPTAFGKYRM